MPASSGVPSPLLGAILRLWLRCSCILGAQTLTQSGTFLEGNQYLCGKPNLVDIGPEHGDSGSPDSEFLGTVGFYPLEQHVGALGPASSPGTASPLHTPAHSVFPWLCSVQSLLRDFPTWRSLHFPRLAVVCPLHPGNLPELGGTPCSPCPLCIQAWSPQ